MPKIEAGAQAGFFLLDGYPYQVGNYEPVFKDGDTEKFGIKRIGSAAKEMDFLADPQPVDDWLDNTDTAFADLASIATYLQNFFFRNPVNAGANSNYVANYRAINFSDIANVAPSPEINETVFVNQSEGTRWLPGKYGGTYYPGQTIYVWNGTTWTNELEEVANALQVNIDDISSIVAINTAQDTLIAANTAKRSYPLVDENKLASITSVGSGQILTTEERRILLGNGSFDSVSTLNPNVVTPVQIPFDNIRGKNALNYSISAGGIQVPFAGFYEISYKFLPRTLINSRLSIAAKAACICTGGQTTCPKGLA
jgi:hypothetical protein